MNFFQKNCSVFLDYLNYSRSICIVTFDSDLNILDCNLFFMSLIGLDQKPINRNLKEFLSLQDQDLSFDPKENNGQTLRFNLINSRRELSAITGYVYNTNGVYVLFGERAWIADHEIIHEISKLNNELANMARELNKKNIALEKANATINDLLKVDALTGLASRRYFLEYYQKMHAQALRHNLPLTLVMSDLDLFKTVNDNYGHQLGDQVLIEFGGLLKENCRKEDLAARFGGEEFITLLVHTDLDTGTKYAERIRSMLETIEVGAEKLKITASFGVAALKKGEEMDSLIKRADDALYEAKEKGRNMVRRSR